VPVFKKKQQQKALTYLHLLFMLTSLANSDLAIRSCWRIQCLPLTPSPSKKLQVDHLALSKVAIVLVKGKGKDHITGHESPEGGVQV